MLALLNRASGSVYASDMDGALKVPAVVNKHYIVRC